MEAGASINTAIDVAEMGVVAAAAAANVTNGEADADINTAIDVAEIVVEAAAAAAAGTDTQQLPCPM